MNQIEYIKTKWNCYLYLIGTDRLGFNIRFILFYIGILVLGAFGLLAPLFGISSETQVIIMSIPVGAGVVMAYHILKDKFESLREEKKQREENKQREELEALEAVEKLIPSGE